MSRIHSAVLWSLATSATMAAGVIVAGFFFGQPGYWYGVLPNFKAYIMYPPMWVNFEVRDVPVAALALAVLCLTFCTSFMIQLRFHGSSQDSWDA